MSRKRMLMVWLFLAMQHASFILAKQTHFSTRTLIPPALDGRKCERLQKIVEEFIRNGSKHSFADTLFRVCWLFPYAIFGAFLIFSSCLIGRCGIKPCTGRSEIMKALGAALCILLAMALVVTMTALFALISRTEEVALTSLGVHEKNFKEVVRACNEKFGEKIEKLDAQNIKLLFERYAWLGVILFWCFFVVVPVSCLLCAAAPLLALHCKRIKHHGPFHVTSNRHARFTRAYRAAEVEHSNTNIQSNSEQEHQATRMSAPSRVAPPASIPFANRVCVRSYLKERSLNSPIEMCAICLCEMQEQYLVNLPCNHSYHQACIELWLARGDDPVCPLCKTIIGKNSTP